MKVTCPKCGSDDIVGNDHLLADANISDWEMDASGELEPVWSGDTSVCWDSQEPADKDRPYRCRKCDARLAPLDLKVEADDAL